MGETTMTLKEQLRAALDLLGAKGEGWTKGAFARNREEKIVLIASVDACKWCAEGAVRKITPHYINAEKSLGALSAGLPKCYSGIDDFNDTHTFPEVKALFERAIAAAELFA